MIDTTFDRIEAEAVTLRRFGPQDAAALSAYRSDPDVARYQGYEACSVAQAEQLIAEWKLASPGTPGEWFQFAVSESDSLELIGDCALHCNLDDPKLGEMGFSFARASQGKGLASASVRALLGYSFEVLGLHRISAVTDERNTNAHRLLERTGFREEGRAENVRFKGELSSERVYVTLAEDWWKA